MQWYFTTVKAVYITWSGGSLVVSNGLMELHRTLCARLARHSCGVVAEGISHVLVLKYVLLSRIHPQMSHCPYLKVAIHLHRYHFLLISWLSKYVWNTGRCREKWLLTVSLLLGQLNLGNEATLQKIGILIPQPPFNVVRPLQADSDVIIVRHTDLLYLHKTPLYTPT
jgi:hypothetical protein